MKADRTEASGRAAAPSEGGEGGTGAAGLPRTIDASAGPKLQAAGGCTINAVREMVGGVVDEKLLSAANPNGAVAGMGRSIVNEEIAADGERQSKLEDTAAAVSKIVSAAVLHVVKTTPPARSIYDMGRDELDAAARKSVSRFKKFREDLCEVLIRRLVAIVGDAAAPDDVLTIFFPPAARKNETYSSSEFDKIIMSLLNKLYKLNALKTKHERPFILQAKVQLDLTSLDVLDVALPAVGRTVLHQGRSEARKSFF